MPTFRELKAAIVPPAGEQSEKLIDSRLRVPSVSAEGIQARAGNAVKIPRRRFPHLTAGAKSHIGRLHSLL